MRKRSASRLAYAVVFFLFALPLRAQKSAPTTSEIDKKVADLDIPALLGQVLMVGYQAEGNDTVSNAVLQRLVRQYHLGNVILYKYNLPLQWAAKDPVDVPDYVASLTSQLQSAAYATQPKTKIPLLIAIDQEGGGGPEMRITTGATAIPSEIFAGTTRSEDLARAAGEAIGSEMRAMGINMVLGPVADIATNPDSDFIGRRSFGSHREIVAPLSAAWAAGLKAGGVLAVAKHFPGHGNAKEDPHFKLADIGYADQQELYRNDLVPFQSLAANKVDGIMTSHIMSPLDDEFPVTISRKSIEVLRNNLKFDGLIISDDISYMTGALRDRKQHIVRTREEVARASLLAGHDMIIFGSIVAPGDVSTTYPERSVTEKQFADIYAKLLSFFENDSAGLGALRRAAARVLRAKATLYGWSNFGNLATWQPQFDRGDYRDLLRKHLQTAQTIAARSVVLISETGQIINDTKSSKYFGDRRGPLKKGVILDDGDSITLVSPVFVPPDDLYELLAKQSWLTKRQIRAVHLIGGWRDTDARRHAKHLWNEEVPKFATADDFGRPQFDEAAIAEKVHEIVNAATSAKVLVFGVLLPEHIRILEATCEELRSRQTQIVVLMFKEPYLLPEKIYRQPNVSVLFLSHEPSVATAVGTLLGDIMPNAVGQVSVSIPHIVREVDPGVLAEVAKLPALPTHPAPGASPLRRGKPLVTQTVNQHSIWGAIVVSLIGALVLYLLPRSSLRVGANQYSRKDLVTILSLGLVVGVIGHYLLPLAKQVTIGVATFESVNSLLGHVITELILSFVVPLLYLKFVTPTTPG